MAEPKGSGTSIFGRPPRWAYFVAAAVVLAGVVFAGAALTSPKRSEPPSGGPVLTELGPGERAAALVGEARKALASGDASAALAFAQDALALDPGNSDASTLVDEIRGRDADGGGATEPIPTAPDDDPFLARVDPRKLLPAAAEGYSFGTPLSDKTDAEVSAEPIEGSNAAATVARVQFAVHDRATAATADTYIATVSKKVYGKDVTQATIHGAPAYVATDGTRLAAVVFVRGRYVFEVIATVRSGDPAGIRALSVAAAKAFPATP